MGLMDGPMFKGLSGARVIVHGKDGTAWEGRVEQSNLDWVRLVDWTLFDTDHPTGSPAGGVARIPISAIAWVQERA
jgi:hypothetical protein